MVTSASAAVVLAAGLGSRMNSAVPKPLHKVLGRPMIAHTLAAAETAGVERIVAVIGPQDDAIADLVAPNPTAVQAQRLGSGHALLQAREALKGHVGPVVVLYGDVPLIRAQTIRRLLDTLRQREAGVAVLGFRATQPASYGRLVVDDDGNLCAIVEASEATPHQLKIGLCNSGVMAIDGEQLWGWLAHIDATNAKGEYYLTDLVVVARSYGRRCVVVESDEDECRGVNTRGELAACESAAQDRMRAQALDGGATLLDPATTFLSWDTKLGLDVTIGPFTVFGPGVTVADGVDIKAFCHLERCVLARGSAVGPYARLRDNVEVGPKAQIGNFVEIKQASIEPGVKVKHMSYVGDARVGVDANIGAGAVICNYDGFDKHRTEIGAGAFIGSNCSLVAPLSVGDGAFVGAGSVVTKNVPADALAVTRSPQKTADGWAARQRRRRR